MNNSERRSLARNDFEDTKNIWFPVTIENGAQVDTLRHGVSKREAISLCDLARGFGETCKVLHKKNVTCGPRKRINT